MNKIQILNKILILVFIFLIIYHLFYELNFKEGLSFKKSSSKSSSKSTPKPTPTQVSTLKPTPTPTPTPTPVSAQVSTNSSKTALAGASIIPTPITPTPITPTQDTPASVIFSQAAINPQGLQQKLMGNPYSYSDYINTPTSMGMSNAGTVDALGKDIAGIQSYIDVLVSGTGNASKTGTSLGNQFFFNTGGKCMDTVSRTLVPRSIYINNIPQGGTKFLTDEVGTNSSSSQGLIPGIMTNFNAFNPFSIMGAFMAGATPDCQQVTLQTVDSYNHKSTETHYITTLDSANIDPCSFTSKINPYTKTACATISNTSTLTPATAQTKTFSASTSISAPVIATTTSPPVATPLSIAQAAVVKAQSANDKAQSAAKQAAAALNPYYAFGSKTKAPKALIDASNAANNAYMISQYALTKAKNAYAQAAQKSIKKEGFTPMMDSSSLISDYCLNIREDTFTQIYFSSLGLVGIYILYCLMMKKN